MGFTHVGESYVVGARWSAFNGWNSRQTGGREFRVCLKKASAIVECSNRPSTDVVCFLVYIFHSSCDMILASSFVLRVQVIVSDRENLATLLFSFSSFLYVCFTLLKGPHLHQS